MAGSTYVGFSLKLFSGFGHTFPWPPAPGFSGGSHGDVSLEGVAVQSLSAIICSGSPETAS